MTDMRYSRVFVPVKTKVEYTAPAEQVADQHDMCCPPRIYQKFQEICINDDDVCSEAQCR